MLPRSKKCYNCNGAHDVAVCDWPSYSIHCTGCLVVSFDGTMHEKPCKPKNKISAIRSNLFATNALTLFKISYSLNETQMVYLNDDGIFSEMSSKVKLISGPVEGILITQDEMDDMEQSISFKQSAFKRCAFFIAILDQK